MAIRIPLFFHRPKPNVFNFNSGQETLGSSDGGVSRSSNRCRLGRNPNLPDRMHDDGTSLQSIDRSTIIVRDGMLEMLRHTGMYSVGSRRIPQFRPFCRIAKIVC